MGSICWMAPELIKGDRRYDAKVDVWSFGIFAFELANGHRIGTFASGEEIDGGVSIYQS